MSLSSLDCESPIPSSTLTERLNLLLEHSGPGYTLSLCPGEQYLLTGPLYFAAPNQEISTASLPTDSTRAMLVVSGTDQTVAVDGRCANCDGVKLRNVQIDGARRGASLMLGGANIEMGGSNADQLIEYVHSFDPRGWSCLHVAQGNLDCTNVTVQNNDIGPAGSSAFQQWADGLSVACRNSVVKNNMINDPTDGAIVLFGSPGSLVENNTIWVERQTLMGGINLVDVSPFGGNFDGVVVTNNVIAGGFASETAEGPKVGGTNEHNAIIKVGIAIGPRVWFGDKYQKEVSFGGRVENNQFTGALSYGIAISSATGFTVQNNVLVGNTSFIGVRSENCSTTTIPTPAPFVLDPLKVDESTTQLEFESIAGAESLVTCVVPPAGSDQWPFRKPEEALGSASVISDIVREMSRVVKPHGHRLDSSAVMFGLFVLAVIVSCISQVLASRQRTPRPDSCRKHVASCKCSAGDVESTRVCSA